MELTIDQALQKAVEAHKAGQVQEADRLYTAILKAQPKHPDANHNMGVIAVGVGKIDAALPFFRTALEANPNVAQFWLSYIDALIKMEKLEDAKSALIQARDMGAKGDGFDMLKQRLQEANHTLQEVDQVAAKPRPDQHNILDTLKLGQAINLANKKAKEGFSEEAQRIYEDILAKFPKNKRANEGLNNLTLRPVKKRSKVQDPPLKQQQALINLYSQGQLRMALQEAKSLLQRFPHSAIIFNIQGAVLKGLGEIDASIEAYKKAVALKPDFAEAYNNLGIALKDQDEMKEAIEAYKKAISIKPKFAEAQNNIGVAFKDQGKLDDALKAYKRALAIAPGYGEAAENIQNLVVQLLPMAANFVDVDDNQSLKATSKILLRPKYHILLAIKMYLQGDFDKATTYINSFKACNQKFLDMLPPIEKKFCNAYSGFIEKLLYAYWDEKAVYENEVYHLGESHCLSYAHRNIKIDNTTLRISPRITFGAKAFHFCRKEHDAFKAITEAHFASLPKRSKVFLSYGEIDCRSNEGFITAARKLDQPMEELINKTTEGYVNWFFEQNLAREHSLYFLNVPAPVYNNKRNSDVNSEVANTVLLFNTSLKKYAERYGFKVVDVFKFTLGNQGFSNGLFHVDDVHLGANAISEIERQLS